MPWGRLDDSLYDHPKLDRLPDRIRLACVGLYALAISWSNRFLTDGDVPDRQVKRFGGTSTHVSALVSAGLWERAEGGIHIHDFAVYNATKAQVLADREVARRRAAMNANPQLQRAIRDRDGNTCRYCGVTVNWRDRRGATGGTYDHILPVVAGGDESIDNLVVSCRGCNERKGPRTPEQAGMTLLDPGQKPPKSIKPVSRRNHDGITESRPDPSRPSESTHPNPSRQREGRRRRSSSGADPSQYDAATIRDEPESPSWFEREAAGS